MKVRTLLACISVATSFLAAGTARAALVTYTSEAAFLAANPNLAMESFENNAGQALASGAAATVNTAGFSVAPVGTATLGVQTGTDSPGPGFGSSATNGTHYLLSYLPNLPTGTLRFDLGRASTSFGLNIIDAGEADGTITISTNAGDTLADLVAFTFPPGFANGNVLFFGFTQADAFTQVFLTVSGVDDAFGIDKVYTVPEPATSGLMLLTLAVLAGVTSRRRRQTA